MTKLTKDQKSILDTYVSIAKRSGLRPTIAELEKAGLSRNRYRHHKFATLEELRKAAREYAPDVFKDIIDEDLFTPTRFKELRSAAGQFKRFVITTAVTGCHVHEGFMRSLRSYCKKNDALLLVMTASDPAAVVTGRFFIDPALKDEYIVFDDLALNKKIWLSAVKLSAKHIDPVTGMGRLGQRNGSFIYASPKQRLKTTATSNLKLPHVVMTTGACTIPAYKSARYMSDRTAYLANHDHVLGAIVVEIQSEKRYHYRQIQADSTGRFADMGVMYDGGETSPYAPEALSLGDFHSGETDDRAFGCFVTNADSVCAILRPAKLIVHDGFNGLSINHHEIDDPILRAQRSGMAQLGLEAEIRRYVADLNVMTEKVEEVVISKSNHDDFLYTYLKKGFYKLDPHNFAFAVRVLSRVVDTGMNPVRAAVELVGGLSAPERIRWLERDEDYKIAGIEVGAHGDKGPNGSRGTIKAMEAAYGNSVSGHSHTPEILRGAWVNGTCSKLKLTYNVGPSSWLHSSTLVYENGMRQLLNVIDGNWRVPDGYRGYEPVLKIRRAKAG